MKVVTDAPEVTDDEIINADEPLDESLREQDVSTLATGAGVAMVGTLSGRGLYAVVQIILARFLGAELFGLYALGWAILRLVGALAPLGLDQGVLRFGSIYWRKDESAFKGVLLQSLLVALVIGLAIAVGLFYAAPTLQAAFGEPGLTSVLRIFAIAFPLFTGLRVLASATRVTQRTQFAIVSEEIAQTVTNLVLVVAFLVLGFRLLGAVAAAVISFGVAFLLAGYYVIRLFSRELQTRPKFAVSLSQLILFSAPTAFASVFITFTAWTDRLFLGYFQSSVEVGIYQALTQISLLFAITLKSINSIFSPMIADLYHNNQRHRLNELYKVSTKWALYVSLPLFIVICYKSQTMLVVIFGDEYAGGALPLLILSIAQIVNVATGSVGFILVMTGHERQWLVISAFALALNIGMNWILIPRLGLVGSAIATAIGVTILYLTGLVRVRNTLEFWPYDRRHLHGLGAAIITAIVLGIKLRLPLTSPVIDVTATLALAYIVFGVALYLLGIDHEDRAFLKLMQMKIQRVYSNDR